MHTSLSADYIVLLAAVPVEALVLHDFFDGRFHLPVHCPERRQSVCVCWPVHLSLNVSAPCPIAAAPPPTTRSLLSRETCTLPDGPHTSSDLVFSVLPVPLCMSTCVYACKYWDQVSLSEGGSAWEHATVLSHRGGGAALTTLSHQTVPPLQLSWKRSLII